MVDEKKTKDIKDTTQPNTSVITENVIYPEVIGQDILPGHINPPPAGFDTPEVVPEVQKKKEDKPNPTTPLGSTATPINLNQPTALQKK